MRLVIKIAFEHGTFAAIAVLALAAWSLACGSESSLKAQGRRDSGAAGVEVGAQASGGSPVTVASGGAGGGLGAGGATPIDAAGGGGVATGGAGVDGAADALALDAPIADATADLPQACGDAVCRSGQTCALIGGGPRPPCDPPLDSGTCSADLVLVDSCDGFGRPSRSPGCTTPPGRPKCYDLPDGCDDFCSCVCGVPIDRGCNPGPGYLLCGRP